MRTTAILVVAATLFASTLATSTAFAAGTQQEKMKTCNADAKTKELKGLDRKKFMSECLSK